MQKRLRNSVIMDGFSCFDYGNYHMWPAVLGSSLEMITGTINNQQNLDTVRIANLVTPCKMEAHTGYQAPSFLIVIYIHCMRYEILTTVKCQIVIFWIIWPYTVQPGQRVSTFRRRIRLPSSLLPWNRARSLRGWRFCLVFGRTLVRIPAEALTILFRVLRGFP
jgi:hypothetical protein